MTQEQPAGAVSEASLARTHSQPAAGAVHGASGMAGTAHGEPDQVETPVEYLSALLGLLDMDAESFDPDLVLYVVKFISMVLASPEVRS